MQAHSALDAVLDHLDVLRHQACRLAEFRLMVHHRWRLEDGRQLTLWEMEAELQWDERQLGKDLVAKLPTAEVA